MSSERWFHNYERAMSESSDSGLSWEAASEHATLRAEEETREQMADLADRLSDEAKEGKWLDS